MSHQPSIYAKPRPAGIVEADLDRSILGASLSPFATRPTSKQMQCNDPEGD